MEEDIKKEEIIEELKPTAWEKFVIKLREFFKGIDNSDLPRPPTG